MSEYLSLMGELKLSGMRASIEHRLDEAFGGNLDFTEFLTLLLSDEKSYRRNRKAEQLTKRAKFNNTATFEDFDADPRRGVPKGVIKRLASLFFLEQSENLIFIGGTGAGKSYLAQAIGHRCCLNSVEALYLPINKLFKQIEEAEVSGTYLKLMEKIKNTKLIILDDFGLRNYTHSEALKLYEILEDRYHKASLVITSQVKPNGWMPLFEDQVIAEAIVDRIVSCSHTIEIKGVSYRKFHAPKERIECKI